MSDDKSSDAAREQQWADELELLQTLHSIRRGLDQTKRGAVRPADEVLREIAAERGIELPR
jgi:hypothetical protein